MTRINLAIAVATLLGAATVLDAAPRGGGGGGIRFGGGGGAIGGYRIGGGGRVAVGGAYIGGGGRVAVGGVAVGRGYNGFGYGRYPYRGYGFNIWLTPGLYGSIPYAARTGVYAPSTFAIPSYYGAPADASEPVPMSNEWGLEITDLADGPAKAADLRKGDIILGVGQTRTQTLEELQKAFAAVRGQVDVVFINGESKNVERLPVTPKDGKVGVTVQPVDLP